MTGFRFLVLAAVALFFIRSLASASPEALKTAEQHFTNKNYKEVISVLADHTDKSNEDVFLMMAAAYSEMNEYDSELRILNQLATKDPKNYKWQMLIAQAHQKKALLLTDDMEKKRQETLAVSAYRQTLKLSPKFRPAFDNLLQIFMDRNENHEARELLMDGIQNFGERAQWLNELCELQALDGFLDPAVKTCEAAIRVSPNYPDNYVYLSQAFLDKQQEQKALKVAQFAGNKFTNSEFAQWAAGKVYLLTKNYEAARKYFERASKLQPVTRRSLEGLADALFQSGSPEEAYPKYQEACRQGAKRSEELHVKAAELRMKNKDSIGAKYRGLAENCL